MITREILRAIGLAAFGLFVVAGAGNGASETPQS